MTQSGLGKPVMAPPLLYPERYAMLDAWRGLAALGVLLHHMHVLYYGNEAVILFFVISGYCICAAAESCMKRQIGFRGFMWRRVRRIYPPYLLSVLFFVTTRMFKAASGGENQLARPFLVWVQNITMTQWLSLLRHPLQNAYDNHTLFVASYWSLNYEEQFYLVIAVIMALVVARGVSLLRLVLPLLGVAILWNIRFPQTSYGVFIEYWAHFCMGCLLFYRLCRLSGRWQRRAVDAFFIAVVAIGGVYWYSMLRAGHAVPFPKMTVSAAFALLLISMRRFSEAFGRSTLATPLMSLGLISYSLYLNHQFNIVKPLSIANRVFSPASHGWANAGLQVAIHLCMATVFWFCCERPFLNRSLTQPSAKPRPEVVDMVTA